MIQAIYDKFGDATPLVLLCGLGVLLIIGVLPFLLGGKPDPLDKLKASQNAQATTSKTARLRTETKKDKLEKYSNFLEPQNAEEFSAVKLKLVQAGYRSRNSVRWYHFSQMALGLIGLVVGIAFMLYKGQGAEVTPELKDQLMYILIPAVVGYMGPKYWVTKRQGERKQLIENAFPDSLDMMLVCIEAGQSLDQAILRISKELRSGFPEMAEEYEIVSYELKAGKDKTQVLRDMAERCGVPDLTSFVTVLIQSQQFGTSIAEALRVYAEEMRDKRVMRAEERANKLPTKMTLATMGLTVPPLLIILIGPSVYGIVNMMSATGN